jgi:integrase
MTRPGSSPSTPYPATLDLDRPSKMSRAHVFLRILILILASWIIGTWGWMGLLYLGLPTTAAVLIALRGAYFDLHNFRTREWKPAQLEVGITPIRRVYDLRHTFATFALRAGVSTFDLSRYTGASLGNDPPPLRTPRARWTRPRDPPPRQSRQS